MGKVSLPIMKQMYFIHHPESEDYLEEEWLYEAISETYIPLLLNFQKLEEEKVAFSSTLPKYWGTGRSTHRRQINKRKTVLLTGAACMHVREMQC